ncbi:unknown [Prevotella sp. CAG:755]|nr:unknown [Prevotella sp. CAG:755]
MGSPAQTGNTDIITADRRKRNNRGSQVHRDWLPLFGITVRALHRQDHRAQTKAYMVTWSMPVGTEMISTSGPQL